MSRTQLVPKKALKKFVVHRVLDHFAILAKYTQGRQCNVPSGKFERLYKAELRKASLHRMAVLVGFLNSARASNAVLDAVLFLFKISANLKSVKLFLVAHCRDFLSGEGDSSPEK